MASAFNGSAGGSHGIGTKPKVLIIDDSAFSRNTLREMLAPLGYEVVGMARDGEEGIFLYEILRPDVVTMDLNMPKMDGLTAIKGIRKFDPDAQIIACSALSGAATIREALLGGARDFIVKPFETARVVEAVARAVRAGGVRGPHMQPRAHATRRIGFS